MAHLKTLERSCTPSFCPAGGLMAAGTVAGAIDMSFSTNSVLEVFSLDFSTSGDALPVVGSIQAPERFNRVAWGAKVPESTQSLGILAGGLADGSLMLWDAAIVLDKDAKAKGKTPLLAKMQKHTGGVKGLEFNINSLNLLASGAADGEICIWDLTKPSTPSLYPALKGGGGPGSAGEIAYISWNRKVAHILASCSSNGSTVVWDLKRQKPVISFRDPNTNAGRQYFNGIPMSPLSSFQRRASVLQWNPDVATQLIVASDDDRSPTLQMWDLRNSVSPLKEFVGHSKMWDLRNSVSPLKEFVGHSKGVLGLSWSPHDTSLLLSSGKDNRTICWDVHTTDIMCELSQNKNWNFDVQWSPTVPGVFSTASFDGHVGVHNIHSCTMGAMVETVNPDFSVSHTPAGDSAPLKKVPAWMRRPAGVAFGFGGKLVSFANQQTQVTDGTGQIDNRNHGIITLSQVVTEHDLIKKSETFEQAIAGGEKETLQSFCQAKAETLTGEEGETWSFLGLLFETLTGEEGETWSFLGLLFEADARRELHRKLGFVDVLVELPPSAPDPLDIDSLAGGVDQLLSPIPTANSMPQRWNSRPLGVDRLLPGGRSPTPTANSSPQAPEDFFNQPEENDPDLFDKLPQNYAPEDFFNQPEENDPDLFDKLPEDNMENEPDFFDKLPEDEVVKELQKRASAASTNAGDHTLLDASTEKEEDIQRALMAGNFELAVETCFKAGRLADALLIANCFNAELFQKSMQRYMRKCPKPYMQIVHANMDQSLQQCMRKCPKPYMQIVRANMDQDFEALVRTRPVGQWRETLALLATYTGTDGWASLCDMLATRLGQAGMHHAASLCYICAGTIDPVVTLWTKGLASARAKKGASESGSLHALQGVIEKAVIFGLATGNKKASSSLAELGTLQGVIEEAVTFGLATGNKKASSSLAELVTNYASILAAQEFECVKEDVALNYASILAAQGCLTTALEYLEYFPREASTTVAVLRDQINRSGSQLPPSGRLTTALEYLEYVPGEASTTVAVLRDQIYRASSQLPPSGRLTTALEYLEYVPGEASTTVAVLRDRIYRSGSQLPPSVTHAPPFPFIQEDVRQVASGATTVPAQAVAAPASSYTQPSAYAQPAAANNYSSYNTSAYGQVPWVWVPVPGAGASVGAGGLVGGCLGLGPRVWVPGALGEGAGASGVAVQVPGVRVPQDVVYRFWQVPLLSQKVPWVPGAVDARRTGPQEGRQTGCVVSGVTVSRTPENNNGDKMRA
eukprot:gene21383-28331_t